MEIELQHPVFLLLSVFAAVVLLWGLQTKTMPVAPFWIDRADYPVIYWSSAAIWLLFCIGFLIAAI